MGELQKDNTDIGFANLFIVPSRMKYIDYTDAYNIMPASYMLSKLEFFFSLLPDHIIMQQSHPLQLNGKQFSNHYTPGHGLL